MKDNIALGLLLPKCVPSSKWSDVELPPWTILLYAVGNPRIDGPSGSLDTLVRLEVVEWESLNQRSYVKFIQ